MTTLNKDGTPRKKGSGKTKGSTSFSYVTLSKLKTVVKDCVPIPVSRKWLNALGVNLADNQPEEQQQEKKVEFTLTEFD